MDAHIEDPTMRTHFSLALTSNLAAFNETHMPSFPDKATKMRKSSLILPTIVARVKFVGHFPSLIQSCMKSSEASRVVTLTIIAILKRLIIMSAGSSFMLWSIVSLLGGSQLQLVLPSSLRVVGLFTLMHVSPNPGLMDVLRIWSGAVLGGRIEPHGMFRVKVYIIIV
jgi:hypothetical protein